MRVIALVSLAFALTASSMLVSPRLEAGGSGSAAGEVLSKIAGKINGAGNFAQGNPTSLGAVISAKGVTPVGSASFGGSGAATGDSTDNTLHSRGGAAGGGPTAGQILNEIIGQTSGIGNIVQGNPVSSGVKGAAKDVTPVGGGTLSGSGGSTNDSKQGNPLRSRTGTGGAGSAAGEILNKVAGQADGVGGVAQANHISSAAKGAAEGMALVASGSLDGPGSST